MQGESKSCHLFAQNKVTVKASYSNRAARRASTRPTRRAFAGSGRRNCRCGGRGHYTGDWISRTRLKSWKEGTWSEQKGGKERGKDYNHSSYNDLIITGLVGLRPRADNILEVNPLLPEEFWDYFCLDNLLYKGRILTIVWDQTGEKYGRGKGLTLLADGDTIAHSAKLKRIVVELK